MTDNDIVKLADEMGFSAAYIDTADVVQDPSFRKFCEDNLCGKYNANYSCPPDCGTVEQVQARLRSGKRALVLQTIWEIGSYDNKEGIQQSKKTHNAAILRFTEKLRQDGHKGFCLGYGGCPWRSIACVPRRPRRNKSSCLLCPRQRKTIYSHSMVPMGTYTHSCTNGKAYTCTYSAPFPARPIDPVPMPPKGKMISRNLFLLYIISFTLSSRVRVCAQQL